MTSTATMAARVEAGSEQITGTLETSVGQTCERIVVLVGAARNPVAAAAVHPREIVRVAVPWGELQDVVGLLEAGVQDPEDRVEGTGAGRHRADLARLAPDQHDVPQQQQGRVVV